MDIQDLLRLIARAERLEALPRTGWLVCGVQNPESVAAHSYMVSLIALTLAQIAERQGLTVDRARLLTIALVHDLPEALITDLPRPVKELLGTHACKAAELDAARTVLEHLPPGLDAYDEYHQGSTLEARLVKAADKIQMLAKALQYHHQRRGDVERFFQERPWLPDEELAFLHPLFDELHQRFRQEEWFPADLD